jgi:hypothetical protein
MNGFVPADIDLDRPSIHHFYALDSATPQPLPACDEPQEDEVGPTLTRQPREDELGRCRYANPSSMWQYPRRRCEPDTNMAWVTA